VLPSTSGAYVWDATPTAGKYAFSVYGPDGFLTSFAGQVVPAGQDSGQVPVVTATLRSVTVEFTLANEGQQEVTYALTPNDFKGHAQTVTVRGGKSRTIGWPTDHDGYYDVVITAASAGGFRRRYAGRIA
jgi:phospholipase C